MPAKIARSTPRPSFGLPELPVAIRISRLASKDAAKSLLSTLVSESSGECRTRATQSALVFLKISQLREVEHVEVESRSDLLPLCAEPGAVLS
jgi:hypothetical protein